MEEIHAFKGAEGDHTVEIHANDDAPFAALVFKTQSEPHVGDVSMFRILSGSVCHGPVEPDDDVAAEIDGLGSVAATLAP